MSLTLHSVVNGPTPNEEWAWLLATAETTLKGYALVDRTFDTAGVVTNEFRHIFIFPDLKVKKDDWVRLYTGPGKYSKDPIKDKPNIHIHNLYWGSDICVYNDKGGDTASLIKYSLVKSVAVPAVAKK